MLTKNVAQLDQHSHAYSPERMKCVDSALAKVLNDKLTRTLVNSHRMSVISTADTRRSTRDVKEECGSVIPDETFYKTMTNYNNVACLFYFHMTQYFTP